MKLNQFTRASLILVATLLLQSCYMYKTVSFDKVKIGRVYEVSLEDGRTIENKCLEVTGDSIVFKARTHQLSFLKGDINTIRRRRNSPVIYVSMAAIVTGSVLSVTTNKKPTILDITSEN